MVDENQRPVTSLGATGRPSGTEIPADWTRDQWVRYADRLLSGARVWASPGAARITPPGAEGGYGHDVDGLEGFARTFLLAGFRIAGERGEGVDDLIDFYSRGIATGVDPASPERWVRLDEHSQAKVEAASIALILDLTRPWIWDRLDSRTQRRMIDYLAPVVGDATYPDNNWLWFRIVVQTFLRSVGGPWSASDIADDLARYDSYPHADGWISDGPDRAYDHYEGWALHLYPVLWSRMLGAADLAGDRTEAAVAGLDRYLLDALTLVGGDGSPLIEGRSLIYRFASAAPFWAGVIAEVPSSSMGRLRHAANRIVAHFAEHGVPDDRDLLSMGWHGPWRRLAQGYSGPGSPYWASKGLLGLSLPADHPVWTAPAEPLPVEAGDTLRTIAAPGWIVSGTRDDGVVRVVNHGTDHAAAGSLIGDSPLYARFGYSTAAAPLHDGRAWREPLEQSVALVDACGRATHRAAVHPLGARIDAGIGIGASTALAHWIDPEPNQVHHGSGITGTAEPAGWITTCSLVRGPWEIRLTRLDDPSDATLRIGGWAVASDTAPQIRVDGASARAEANGLVSVVRGLTDGFCAGVAQRTDASPLGERACVPFLETPAHAGRWHATLIGLAGRSAPDTGGDPSRASVSLDGDRVAAVWPDGRTTAVDLTDFRNAAAASRQEGRDHDWSRLQSLKEEHLS